MKITSAALDDDILPLDVEAVRKDFPILHQRVNGRPLVYLDSGASSQKPEQVIHALSEYERRDHSNVHRGVHTLSQRATEAYEGAREKIRRFVNAGSVKEIVFTRGTTEAINLVAQSYGRSRLGPGDEVMITEMEHHANIVPWQLMCQQTGAVLKVAPFDDNGELIMARFSELLSDRTRLVAMTQVSNALGTINPVQHMVQMAHDAGALVLIDGAQAVPHGLGAAIDYVTTLGMDRIAAHERQLLDYATGQASAEPGMRIFGNACEKAAILSFELDGIHPHDVGTILDHEGVAVRTGHHCAMPVMEHFGVPATTRATFGPYNTEAEVDSLFAAIGKAREMFRT